MFASCSYQFVLRFLNECECPFVVLCRVNNRPVIQYGISNEQTCCYAQLAAGSNLEAQLFRPPELYLPLSIANI